MGPETDGCADNVSDNDRETETKIANIATH